MNQSSNINDSDCAKWIKYCHSMTCPYNPFGRVWMSSEEYQKLQEDRDVSMTNDYLLTLPEEIREEYLSVYGVIDQMEATGTRKYLKINAEESNEVREAEI